MNTLDCRGMACPAPVISVKRALEEQSELLILLEDGAPRENVTRFARNRGFQVSEERDGSGWALAITPGSAAPTESTGSRPPGERVLLITSDRLGDGPDELGGLLMKNFIHTLLEAAEIPDRMFFMNRGVFLTTTGSEVVEALEKLRCMGVEILSCGLCLDFFNLKEKLAVGSTTNMLATVEGLMDAARAIKL